jgi:iron-sulfur cluster repair protein YtfE (RIC family)
VNDGPAGVQTLLDEHQVLRHEVEVRRRDVLLALGDGDWPAAQLLRLVDYLHFELIDQAVNEERLLFPPTPEGRSDPRVAQLIEDHVELRDAADALARLAALPDEARDPAQVVTVLDELHEALDRHLADEESVLSPAGGWGVSDARHPYRPHQWYPLTEGPAVDADALPPEAATRLLIGRLTRMRPGERLEISSRSPLRELESAFARRRMSADYGWTVEDERPGRCRVSITRRRTP